MSVPKVSVCIDSFNYGRYLPEAIDSVLRQSFTDFEIIISDDRSTDDSFAIAQRYAEKDARIRAVQNPQNLGMVKNRNACLALARGEFVKTLHADDFLSSPDALAQMVAALESNPIISLVAAARRIVDERGRTIDIWSSLEEQKRPIAGTTIINRCLFEQRNLIGGPSAVMFRRCFAGRGFDESFFVMADMEMWFHLLEQGFFLYLADPLCAFRTHGSQQTEKDKSSLAPALENHALLQRYLPKRYIRLRRWLRKYLEYDAVRRIVRRSRKLRSGREEVEAAIQQYGGWRAYRARAFKHRYRESILKVRRLYDRHLRRTPRPEVGPLRPPGINLAGFAQSQHGIGESSRAMWRAVQASGLPSVLINVRSRMHSNQDESLAAFTKENPYRINLMTFSFDYARRFYRDMGPRFFAGRHNIGLWYWEQEHFPLRWHSAFDYYDEIWVPTEFTRKAIAAASPIPVNKITYPFFLDETQAIPDRARFGLAGDAFVFLFNFDFLSTTQRKNPAALIEAFRRAFQPNENAVLVLKTINGQHDRAGREALGRASEGANIVFLDDAHPRRGSERALRLRRLLRLPSSLRRPRPRAGAGDVSGQAGDRDRLLRQS